MLTKDFSQLIFRGVGVGNVTWFVIPSLALATVVILEKKFTRPNHYQ